MKYFKFKNIKINQLDISILIGLITAIFFCFFNLVNSAENISNNILRLHILANSDSTADQQLKLQLKDAILSNFNFDKYANNINLAKEKIAYKLNDIEKFSKDFVKNKGFNYDVKVSLEKTNFNTRSYDKFALPAGDYDALRIKIGSAKGHNWWCVFVPSLCVPAASNTKQKIKSNFKNNEADLIEKGSKTEIRFAALELYNKIKKILF